MIRPESETKVASMFDTIAKRYDFLNSLLSARQDRRWRKQLLKQVPKVSNGTFLDVATGTGDVILGAAIKRPEYSQFIGVDISENMLKLADQKAEARKLNQTIDFKQMSAERIELPDNSVDCLSISFGLRNVINKENALAEFYRVLKPGGTLLILEFFLPQTGALSSFFQFYFHQVLPRIGGFFSSSDAYNYLPKSVASFYSSTELEKALAEHKLPLAQVTSWMFGSCRLVRSTK
jgi:demethylmenaquinone methyltransferase/2-methoxy-6-polyprenyl-1,4-benzoquinol methylase